MKKLNRWLNIITVVSFVYFIIRTIINYREYKLFPEIYEINSAPWYTYGALPAFLLFLVVVIINIVIKIIVRVRESKGSR